MLRAGTQPFAAAGVQGPGPAGRREACQPGGRCAESGSGAMWRGRAEAVGDMGVSFWQLGDRWGGAENQRAWRSGDAGIQFRERSEVWVAEVAGPWEGRDR